MCSFCHRLQSIFVSFFAVPETRWWCRTSGKPPQLHIERNEESLRSAVLAYVPFYLDPCGAGETLTEKEIWLLLKRCPNMHLPATMRNGYKRYFQIDVCFRRPSTSDLTMLYPITLRCFVTVEPRFKKPLYLYWQVLGFSNDLLRCVNSKIYENEPRHKETSLWWTYFASHLAFRCIEVHRHCIRKCEVKRL